MKLTSIAVRRRHAGDLAAQELADHRGPPGINHIVALVSRQPRDFSRAGLKNGEAIAEFDPTPAEQAWRAAHRLKPRSPATPLAGPTGCDSRYGATLIRIEEVAAAK